MKILIFMSDNRPLSSDFTKSEYNSLVAAINYTYCKKYGYDFLYYRPYLNKTDTTSVFNCLDPKTKELRHASWSKLLATCLAIDLGYDSIVYIDSDCIFKDFDTSLETFIKPSPEKTLVFLNNKPVGKDKPCAGFYYAKVCKEVRDFVKEWYDVDLPLKNKHHAWEQDALWFLGTRPFIGIIDSWMFQEEKGQYLRHISSFDNVSRVPYFKKFLTDKNINFSETISEIKVVEFETEPTS